MIVRAVVVCLLFWTLPGYAFEITQCDRITHVSHGGEDQHQDLGEGRVMWRTWWSQEGTATDFTIMECASGEALRFRTAAENMGPEVPFDRTDDVLKVIDRHGRGARVFATLARMAEDLKGIAKDVTIKSEATQSCACAALYPEMRGEKQEFAFSD